MTQLPFDYSNIPRDSRRVPIATKVAFKFDKFSGFISEFSANISPTGMFITIKTPEPPGSMLDFEFRLGDGFEIIQGKGEVVWTRAIAEGPNRPPGMGIRFLDLGEGSKELIYRIVDQYIQDGGTPFDVSLRPPDLIAPPALEPAPEPMPVMPILSAPVLDPIPPPVVAAPRPAASAPATPATPASVAPRPSVAEASPFALPPLSPLSMPSSASAPASSSSAGASALSDLGGLLPVDSSAWLPPLDGLDPKPLDDDFPPFLPPFPPMDDPEPIRPTLTFSTLGSAASSAPEPRSRVIPLAIVGGLLALAAAGYVYRGPLMAMVGLGAEEAAVADMGTGGPPSQRAAVPPAPVPNEETPAPTSQGTEGTVIEETGENDGRLLPEAVRRKPADEAQPAAAPAPVQAAPVAPAPSAPAGPVSPASPAVTVLNRITFEQAAGGTDLILWGNGAIRAESYEASPVGNPPRELVKIYGIAKAFAPTVIPVGTGEVKQVRTGFHEKPGRNELHVVIDLAATGVKVTRIESKDNQLRIHLQRQ